MSVKNTIWFVAKIIIGTALFALVFTAVSTYVLIFIFRSRINAVGENMQAELTKNNTLYTESYIVQGVSGNMSLAGFAAQLQRIAEQSDGIYTFKGISVIGVNDLGAEEEHMLLEMEIDASTGEATGNFSYAEDKVGAYGDFRTLRLYFDVHTDIMMPAGTPAVTNLVHIVSTYPVYFDYEAPCLRYLKGGETP